LGISSGIGAGLFWSNAKSFKSLKGDFDTTQLSLPLVGWWGLGIEVDRSGDVTVFSLTLNWGWGAGFAQYKTTTPEWSIKNDCGPMLAKPSMP
jgi:hypothetical protein